MDGLILVDLQNDFMPGGALAVAGGDTVVPVANALAPRFDTVVATRDWHPANHGSFVTAHPGLSEGDQTTLAGLEQVVWPVHCVQETHGAAFHDRLNMTQVDEIISKVTDPDIDSYSAFFDNGHRRATGLETYLRSRGVGRIYILVLATDYCVKYSALDALQLAFETWVVEDGCRGVELETGDTDAAIREMSHAGIRMVRSRELLGS
jgi:nicotinamidase/pyrazinamidase